MSEPRADTELRGPSRVARNFEHTALHDPEQARAQGFRGALVGVAYNLWLPSSLFEAHFGDRWLERGRMTVRFVGPVYEGDTLTAVATPAEDGAAGDLDYRVENEDGQAVMTGLAGWAPDDDPEPEPDEPGSAASEDLLDLASFRVGERLRTRLTADAGEVAEYCRRNEDPRAEEDRVPVSYLATFIFGPARRLLSERGAAGALFGTLDIRLHRRLRRGAGYDYDARVLGLRRRGQLELIDLEMRAYEGGSLACAVTQTHIIPHRDRPPDGDGS